MSPRVAYLLMLVATLCGCGRTELPSQAAIASALTPAKLEPQLLDDAAWQEAAEPAPPAAEPVESVVTEAPPTTFEPPFPHRENVFLAPKRSSTHAKSQGSGEQTVELLGFANVAEPKVILSINGIVVPISEGEQQSGIEVISIQPPAVVLQRDRERWQATLEN